MIAQVAFRHMFRPGSSQRIQLYVGRRSGLGFGQLSGLCTAWEFAFSAPEAYLIEDGWLTRTLTGVTLLGNGPATLAWQAVKRQLTSERLCNQALNSGTVEGA
jgi:hypothetical protein